VPEPDFLDAVLGHFNDPRVGFVQAAVGFRNDTESWTARATAEQCEDAYGPASLGMHGCDAAPVWGSHCTFRRAALDSVGGHGIGLAEDLQTSMTLHAAGWRSVFVPALKARGLVPSDYEAVAKQQFKWARGVFEVLLSTYPRVWHRLSPSQNVAYLLRCTYYLIGPLFLVHALLACALLLAGSELGRAAFANYLLCSLPLAAAIMMSRRAALALWAQAGPKLLRWRGYVQAFGLWPIYSLALACALLRIRVDHISTPKVVSGRAHLGLAFPQLVLLGVLAFAVAWRLAGGVVAADVLPLSFALVAAYVQVVAIRTAITT
jgi:cellulose synthase (UDP-forming)